MLENAGRRVARIVAWSVGYPLLVVVSLMLSAYFAVAARGTTLVAAALEDKFEGRGSLGALAIDPATGSLGLAGLAFDGPDGEKLLSVGSVVVVATSPLSLGSGRVEELKVSDVELSVVLDADGKTNWERLKKIKPPKPPSAPEPFSVGGLAVENGRISFQSPMADVVVGPFSVGGSLSGDEKDNVNVSTMLRVERIRITVKEHEQTADLLAMLSSPEVEVGPIEVKVEWSEPHLTLHRFFFVVGEVALDLSAELDLNSLNGRITMALSQADTKLLTMSAIREGEELTMDLTAGPLTIPSIPLPSMPLPPVKLGKVKLHLGDGAIEFHVEKQPLPDDLLFYILPEGGSLDLSVVMTPDTSLLTFLTGLSATPDKEAYFVAHAKTLVLELGLDLPQFLWQGEPLFTGFKLAKARLELKGAGSSAYQKWSADELVTPGATLKKVDYESRIEGVEFSLADLAGMEKAMATPEGKAQVMKKLAAATLKLTMKGQELLAGEEKLADSLLLDAEIASSDKGKDLVVVGKAAPLGEVKVMATVSMAGADVRPYSAKVEIPSLNLLPIVKAAQLPGMVAGLVGGTLAGRLEWSAADMAQRLWRVSTCDLRITKANEVIELVTPEGVQEWDLSKDPDFSPMVLMRGGEIKLGKGKLIMKRASLQAGNGGVVGQ